MSDAARPKPGPAERWEAAAAFAVVVATAVSAAGWTEWLWADCRVWLALASGVLLPGYLLVRLLVPAAAAADWLETIAPAFAAGFVLQLPWCIGMMNLGGSSRLAALLQLLLTAALCLLGLRRGVFGALAHGIAEDLRAFRRGGAGACRVVLLATLLGLAYVLSPFVPYAENEEMLIGRKLFENPSLSVFNVMHRPDEPTTYLYPVYMFLQAFLGHLSHLDVIVVHVKLRCLLAVLALVIQYALMAALTGRTSLAAAYTLVLVGLVVWDPNSWSYGLGILLPFNNRFGVAPAVLMPLGLYLLALVHRRPPSAHVAALWVLFVFASSLVHTKEALHVLMVAGGLLVAGLALRPRDRAVHARLAAALLALVVLFGAFKRHHEARVPYMVTLVEQVKQEARQERRRLSLVSRRPWLGGVHRRIETNAGSYDLGQFGIVVATPRAHTVGFYFVLALALLPLMPLACAHWQAVYLWAMLFTPLALVRAPILYVTAAEATGTTDLELVAPLLAQAGLLAVAAAVAAGLGFVFDLIAGGTREVDPWLRRAARWTVVGGVASGGFWLLREAAAALDAQAQADQTKVVTRALMLSLAALVVAAAGARLGRWRVKIDASAMDGHPLLAAVAFLVLFAPPTSKRHYPDLFRLSREASWQRGIVSLEHDYPKIAAVFNINTRLPLPLVLFIRNTIGPQHVFATTPRELNRLLVYTNSYISHAPAQIATYLDVEYFDLVRRLGGDPIFDRDRMPAGESAADRDKLLRWYLQRYGVEYVLAPPEARVGLDHDLETRAPLFQKVYDRDGWAIWKVNRSLLEGADRPAAPAGKP